jgi:hypothetical protein
MDDPLHPLLKIADTPEGEVAAADTPPTDAPPAKAIANGKRRKGRSLVQRLTPEEMDDEIRRVNLANGHLMIAEGTEPDSPDEA